MGSASTQPLHRVTLGRTREVRGPDAFERGFAGIIIAIVAMLAAWFGVQLACMVQSLDAVSLASGAETDEIVYHTVHGHWPETGTPGITNDHAHSLHARNLSIDGDGAITADLALGRVRFNRAADTPPVIVNATYGRLSFRPELIGSRDAPSVTFLCGYAKPVTAAANISGSNRTTLPRRYLPPFCR